MRGVNPVSILEGVRVVRCVFGIILKMIDWDVEESGFVELVRVEIALLEVGRFCCGLAR